MYRAPVKRYEKFVFYLKLKSPKFRPIYLTEAPFLYFIVGTFCTLKPALLKFTVKGFYIYQVGLSADDRALGRNAEPYARKRRRA